jgi:hypothetical protein
MSDDVSKTHRKSGAGPGRRVRATAARPVICELPDMLSLLPGKARLVEYHLADLLRLLFE